MLASITLTAKYFTVTTNAGVSLHQRQVKDEVGGKSYPVLSNNSEINLNFEVRYNINEYFSAGVYYRYDFGNIQSSYISLDGLGDQAHFDYNYNESWVGPIVKGHYKDVFLGLGYGLMASRSDMLGGIANEEYGLKQFTASSIAWLVQLGGQFELSESLDLNIMVEYRVRYYDEIEESNINGKYVIGTQNITPMAG
ncbi:MAG: hypothetical protein RIF34_03520, partial [Candidatus Kapaibacterium sp.]